MPQQLQIIASCQQLSIAIASLSIGGAEKIVVDHAARLLPNQNLRLVVLRDRAAEWPVPAGIETVRLESGPLRDRFLSINDLYLRRLAQLRFLGEELAKSDNPVCLCHLLSAAERNALAAAGGDCVPVLHNAAAGWGHDAADLKNARRVIAVSAAAASELREAGFSGHIDIIRHIPPRRAAEKGIRQKARASWGLPQDALVIGMVGAVKRQKNYPRAIEIITELNRRQQVYLCILGGPVNTSEGRQAWEELLAAIDQKGVRERVAAPGFVADGGRYLPAFDLILNSSHFEGLSIATLEALQSGLPVVATRVGGQGELAAENLHLFSADDEPAVVADRILPLLGRRFSPPAWSGVPSQRLWTLAGLVPDKLLKSSGELLLVTANLNSGGAQRSLVNLATRLHKEKKLSIAVAGPSTSATFCDELQAAGVDFWQSCASYRPFDSAEVIIQQAVARRVATVCFWNLDPKVKLLVAKALAHTDIRLIDVSPGGYAFSELGDCCDFAELIGFSADDYYRRLDRLVHKFNAPDLLPTALPPVVIPNGVDCAGPVKHNYRLKGPARIAVNGRLAPSKFIVEIIRAARLVRAGGRAVEIHLLGGSETLHDDYLARIEAEIALDAPGCTRIYGHSSTVPLLLAGFDLQITLGRHQGCPNATLEALAAGLPLIANNDGGSGEQVIDRQTGLLLESCHPPEIAVAMSRLIDDRRLAARLGRGGREYICKNFSLEKMTAGYRQLFSEPGAKAPEPQGGIPCRSISLPIATPGFSVKGAMATAVSKWRRPVAVRQTTACLSFSTAVSAWMARIRTLLQPTGR